MMRAAFLAIRRAYWRRQVAACCRDLSAYIQTPCHELPAGWNVETLARLQRRALAAQQAYGRAMARYDARAAA